MVANTKTASFSDEITLYQLLEYGYSWSTNAPYGLSNDPDGYCRVYNVDSIIMQAGQTDSGNIGWEDDVIIDKNFFGQSGSSKTTYYTRKFLGISDLGGYCASKTTFHIETSTKVVNGIPSGVLLYVIPDYVEGWGQASMPY